MRHLLLVRISHFLNRSENKKRAMLWDKAEPVSLEELKAKFTELARNELAYNKGKPLVDSEEPTFEELWKIFESLEELEDLPLIS